MKEIYHCFWVNASTEKVCSALTEKKGLVGWWTKSTDHEGTVDSVSTFRFKSGAFNRMRVAALAPDRIEWECVDGNPEWIGTRVRFELRPDDSRTKVCFSHSGWREKTEYFGECSFYWAWYFVSLQKYCETGRGTPNKGP